MASKNQTYQFQSTLPRGSDETHKRVALVCLFQSTLPRGSDETHKRVSPLYVYFNPRSLAGATYHDGIPYAFSFISIHAPSRERLMTTVLMPMLSYFNPRSLAGATLNCLLDKVSMLFQSTLPRGSDFVVCMRLSCIAISIHAPSRERPVV